MNVDLFGNPAYSEKRNMRDFFIVPPFSVLDTTDKLWIGRKRRWLQITGDLTATKDGVLVRYQEDSESEVHQKVQNFNGGSSNFDPVLAEIVYKWFCLPGGRVLDPFGGEQTKGVVCGELGYNYSAVEFRKEQVELNASICSKYENVKYVHGDSNYISTLIPERDFDFCFTSPPYYDLEVYSAEDMSALGTYEEFMAQYKNIFKQCYEMLADNRFLVVKIGEIRDKKTGIYRNFVGDNISIFREVGFHYYNEIILLNSVGTLPLRVNRQMNAGRKVGKMHQNLLVFYKGDPKKIKNVFPELVPENKYYEYQQNIQQDTEGNSSESNSGIPEEHQSE